MKLIILWFVSIIFIIWVLTKIILQWPDKFVHIIFCDVGQGDAVLITYKNHQMLIDGGSDEKILFCLKENIPFWDKSLDFLVITHMDYDHIGGLPSVLSSYSADIILSNPSLKKTAGFEALETVISRKNQFNTNNSQVISSFIGQQLKMTDLIRFIVISPQVEQLQLSIKNSGTTETILQAGNSDFTSKIDFKNTENNLSIGIFVIVNEVKILLTGDMEKEGELAVIKSGMTDQAHIIKAGHHGSKSSSTRQFISIMRPEISVISSGLNNQYKHPSPQVIDVFNEFLASIYRTDSQGTIKFVTNGVKYWRAI